MSDQSPGNGFEVGDFGPGLVKNLRVKIEIIGPRNVFHSLEVFMRSYKIELSYNAITFHEVVIEV